jgi:hypothetical protein
MVPDVFKKTVCLSLEEAQCFFKTLGTIRPTTSVTCQQAGILSNTTVRTLDLEK